MPAGPKTTVAKEMALSGSKKRKRSSENEESGLSDDEEQMAPPKRQHLPASKPIDKSSMVPRPALATMPQSQSPSRRLSNRLTPPDSIPEASEEVITASKSSLQRSGSGLGYLSPPAVDSVLPRRFMQGESDDEGESDEASVLVESDEEPPIGMQFLVSISASFI